MDSVALLQVGSAFLLNLAFAWMAGTLLARFWLGPAKAQRDRQAVAILHRTELAAAGLCFMASCGALWAAAGVMGGVPLDEASGLLPTMLSQTAYGQAGLTGLAALCLIGGLNAFARDWRGTDLAIGALLLAFAVSRASISHAGEHGLLSLGFGIEWIHLLLIALWVGGVAVAGWVVLPLAQRHGQHGGVMSHYLHSLSQAATIALAGILATGIYNSWQRLGTVDNLLGNSYGTALIVKLLLFALAVGLGGYNKMIGFPRFAVSPGMGWRVIAILRVESVLLLAALVAVAVLTSQQPPAAL